MITVNKFARIFALLLLCTLAVIFTVSCSKETTSDALAALNQKDAPDSYRIVIPSDADSNLAEKAKELAGAVSDKTGAECYVRYDNEILFDTEAVFEILLGHVDRTVVHNEFFELRRDDYICKAFENYIILGGKSSSASVAAVDRFLSDIMPYATTVLLMDADAEFAHYAEYEIDSLRLCGFELSDYRIVSCGEKGSAEAELASGFRELVADRCGAYPALTSDAAEGKKEIIFRLSDNAGDSSVVRITKEGEDVCVTSDSCYGLSVGVERLYGLLFSAVSDGVASLDIDYELTYTYSASELSLMTVVADIPDSSERIDLALRLAESINVSRADAVALGALDADTLSFLISNLDSRFAVAKTEDEGEGWTVAVYNSEKFTLAECTAENQTGIVTIALEFKSTGQIVCVYSLLETDADKRDTALEAIKVKLQSADKPALAVFLTRNNVGGEMSVTGEGISTQYNAVLGNNNACRHAVFSTADMLDCYEKQLINDENDDYTLLRINAREVYSKEYLALLHL